MGRPTKLPLILEALKHAPAGLTQVELQRITGASAGTVHRYIHQLHDERRVYIGSWKTDMAGKLRGGVYQARYRIGRGADMQKPAPLTPTQIKRRIRTRAKQAGELQEYLAKKAEEARRAYWRKKPVRRDPLIAAMFGATA